MIFFAKIIKKTTNFMISWEKSLESCIKNHKKLIIIFWHPKCKPCQMIMLKIPYLYIKCLVKWITLKFCNVLENSDSCKKLWIQIVPYLFYFKNWEIVKKIDTESDIFKFLKNFKL